MRNIVTMQRLLKDELIEAVVNHQLELHYQPQVRLQGHTPCGAEALLRWNHPTRGILMPAAFLSVLETHTLALQVGCWIIDEACRQVAEWRATGHPEFRVSVNLFAAQVNDDNLPGTVAETLARHGLPPDALEIEVTETIVLDHDERALQTLRLLHAMGVRIAFDDFGTGYASLSMLTRFPLTTLKIDRSFIRNLGPSGNDHAIVRALVSMGREMGLDVIAEGIETISQQEILRTLGCEIGQGYLYSKALPIEAFCQLLATGTRRDASASPAATQAGRARSAS